MAHYGLSLLRPDGEERTDFLTDERLEPGAIFDRSGERWLVEAIEPSELGRFEAWLVCTPADDVEEPPPHFAA